jgi:hypothetical protein
MLLKEAIDFFNKSSKYKSLTYRVHKRNNPSISLVTKAGFSELSPKYLDKKIAESERVYILNKQGYLYIGGKKVKVIQQKINEVITDIKIPVATHLAASSFLFSQSFRLSQLADQSQKRHQNQRQIIVNGKTIFVAPFARYQIPLPIKI